MQSVKFAQAYVVAAIVLGVIASAAHAYSSRAEVPPRVHLSGFSHTAFLALTNKMISAPASSLLSAETAVLTDQGISPARAAQAIGVQGAIARTGLVQHVETALDGAFAGVWFEASSARMHIGVTSARSRDLAKAVVTRAGLSRYVVETSVRSTWDQLLAAQGRWDSRLEQLVGREQAETALHPRSNTVVVELSSSTPARERRAIEHEASSDTVNIAVSVVPAAQLQLKHDQQTSCNQFASDKANCNKTITSGVGVGPTEAECTVGPLAISTGTNKTATYLLTAGHCISRKGESFSAFDRAGTAAEIGKSVDLLDNEAGDYGDIQIENNAWKNAGADPVLAVTAEWDTTENRSYPVIGERQPMQGATNCHEGITTGQSCGLIEAVNANVRIAGITVKGLVKDSGPSLKAAGGDSGGPWLFVDTGKNVMMEGTHISSGVNGASYEPLLTSLSSLKLELLTTANEIRPALGIFQAGTGKPLGKATNTQVWKTPGGNIECTSLKPTEGEASSKILLVTIEYTSCKAFGAGVTVSLAKYAYNSGGFVSLLNTITITSAVGACSVKISSSKFQELRTIKYSNTGKELQISANLPGITSMSSGGICGEETTKGTFTGESIFGVEGGTLNWE